MAHKFSVVIPCYNCAATLEEAVDSVYRQGFRGPFEIVAVDDGSKDRTRELLGDLAKEHPEMRVFFHEKNRGGGAARNTGIRESSGDLIFCLDSDNILGDGVLPKMAAMLDETRCDGVQFERRKFFMDDPQDRRITHFNKIVGEPVRLENLFDESDTLLDNFLFTKTSWSASGGYPENHGFDTQCFEIRYLAAGHRVFTCPDTVFYHRLSKSHSSYFQRVYQNGEFSKNFYLIYEDIFHLFSRKVRRHILEFDIFGNTKLAANDLKTSVCGLFRAAPQEFFIPEKVKYLKPEGLADYVSGIGVQSSADDAVCIAILAHKRGDYRKALASFQEAIAGGLDCAVLYYDVLRSSIGLAGGCPVAAIEDRCARLVGSMVLKKNPVSYWKIHAVSLLSFLKSLQRGPAVKR